MKVYQCINLFILFTGYILNLCHGQTFDNWPSLSTGMVAAVRGQRDLSEVITVDQLTRFGVSLNSMVFEKYGYVSNTNANILSILQVGARVLTMDVYWNEISGVWQLCPAPYPTNSSTIPSLPRHVLWNGSTYYCEPNFNVDFVMNTILLYFQGTNSNLEVNSLHIIFNLKTISYSDEKYSPKELQKIYRGPLASIGNSTLNATVSSIQSLTFTPVDLLNYKIRQQDAKDDGYETQYNNSDTNFPSLDTFLYTDIKRSTIALNLDDYRNSSYTYNFTDSDNLLFFIMGRNFSSLVISSDDVEYLEQCSSVPINEADSEQLFEEVTNKTEFRFVIDNDDSPFTNETFRSFLNCGFGPILNASEYDTGDNYTNSLGTIMNQFTSMSLWLWSPGQPQIYSSNSTNLSNDTETSEVAYRCGALDETGVYLANCYEEYPYACQKQDSPYEWKINPKSKRLYFSAYSDSDACPEGYFLGVPLLSLQILSLYDAIVLADIPYPIWVNLNDLTVENCFVTGGPYASCPYQKTYTKRKLIGLIAPGFFVSLFLLCLIALGNIFRVNPIQTNRRRYWKKAIKEYNAGNEYEGVPS